MLNKKLFSILCIFLALISHVVVAIVRTEETNEWTKDSLGSYFNKYKILYDKKADHRSLIDIAKSYKDAATSNTKIFGSGVDNIISGFTNNIQKHAGLAENDVEGFITSLKHQLRQLELKGQLNKDRVRAVLDKAHIHAVRQKIMTESEWKKAYAFFESLYQPPTWYQRVLRIKPDVDDGADSLNNWIHSTSDRISHLAGLTKEQSLAVRDQLRSSISKGDLFKLGDKAWVDDFVHSVSKKTELSKDQINHVVESITKDVNGYKIFALDYTGQAKDQALHWCCQVKNYLSDLWETIQRHVYYWYRRIQVNLGIKKQEPTKILPSRVTDSFKSAASSIQSEWNASSKSKVRSRSIESVKSRVSTAASHATSKINNFDFHHGKSDSIKDSFAHFWRKKEHDAYRKLGYTEAHIDWIQNYLHKTFKNQKTSVKGRTDEAAIAIKRYLNDLGIQSPTQVDANVHKLKRHLESWRTLIN
jgi:hypothetical protein